jgi:hypothetical protein
MERKNSATGTISRIEARKYLLVAVGLATRCWRRLSPRKKKSAGSRHPCALTKKIKKATRATAATSVDQIMSRRGSSLGGSGSRAESDRAGGAR